MAQQVGEVGFRIFQEFGCEEGVKEVDYTDAEVPFQPFDVLVRPVEYFEDAWVCEYWLQLGHMVPERKGVDHIIARGRADLEQAGQPRILDFFLYAFSSPCLT
jgi:hypothetical protein